jgi:hypothetical protein
MQEKRHLTRFVETSEAFDNNSKLKAILFAAGAKPNTFIHLRVQKNLHDKHEFERLLKLNKILFEASRAKGFEEITGIKKNATIWRIKGTWYGYDLFRNKKAKKQFHKYVDFVRKRKHDKADQTAGKLYGYPNCCINKFIEEHDPKSLPGKYTYYQYYKRLHDSDIAFPFISHTPCSPKCNKTRKLNKKYEITIKKSAPKFYKQYARKRIYTIPVIVDMESDIGVWKKKDGHDYSLITQKPVEGKYLMISWLSKAKFKRGTIIQAKIVLQYDYAAVSVQKKIGELRNFHHERKFSTP